MKQTILYLLLGIFLLASCHQEDLSDAGTGYGYLSVSELSVATTQVHVVSSRADEEPLTVEILKDGETVKNLTETELANKIELEAGTGYSLKVYSSDYGKESEWTNEDKGTPVYYRYPDEEEIAGIGAVAVTDGIMKDGYGVGAVMVKRASTGKWQQNYVSFGAGTGDSGYFWQGSDFGIGNAVTPVGRLQGSDECFFMTSREGQLFHPAKHWRNDEIFALEAHFDTYTLEEATAAKLNGLTTGAMIDPDHYIVIGDYISILEYDPAADNWGWIIHSSEEVAHEASSLTISPDGCYAYYVDIDADEIVTLEIAEDGRSVEEIGRTALSGNGIDTLSLSPSGMNIIAFDESDASEVTVMRVSR